MARFRRYTPASISRSIRADRPAPARAPVAARSDETITETPTTAPAATTAKAAATTTAKTAATTTTTAAATSATARFRGSRCRCRHQQRRTDQAERIDRHQSERGQTALEDARTYRVLGHKKNLQFQEAFCRFPAFVVSGLRPVQAHRQKRCPKRGASLRFIHRQTRGKAPRRSSNRRICLNNGSRFKFPKTPNIVFTLPHTMVAEQ